MLLFYRAGTVSMARAHRHALSLRLSLSLSLSLSHSLSRSLALSLARLLSLSLPVQHKSFCERAHTHALVHRPTNCLKTLQTLHLTAATQLPARRLRPDSCTWCRVLFHRENEESWCCNIFPSLFSPSFHPLPLTAAAKRGRSCCRKDPDPWRRRLELSDDRYKGRRSHLVVGDTYHKEGKHVGSRESRPYHRLAKLPRPPPPVGPR